MRIRVCNKGMVLIFTLWVLGILTILAVSVAAGIRQKISLVPMGALQVGGDAPSSILRGISTPPPPLQEAAPAYFGPPLRTTSVH